MPSPGTREKSSMSRKTPVLIPSSHVTALVNGGRLNVIGSPVRRTEFLSGYSTRLIADVRCLSVFGESRTARIAGIFCPSAPEPALLEGCDVRPYRRRGQQRWIHP